MGLTLCQLQDTALEILITNAAIPLVRYNKEYYISVSWS